MGAVKKAFILVLTALLATVLFGCESTADRWQEQYDLVVKYLSEGNYEEAILAFSAAIEIEPMRPPAYVGRGDSYDQLSCAAGNSALPQNMTYEEAATLCQRRCDFVIFRRTQNVRKRRVKVYSL